MNNESFGIQMGLSFDESIGYNKSFGGKNFNYYFNNYTSETQVMNKQAFMLVPQMLKLFWQYAASHLPNDDPTNAHRIREYIFQ